MNNKIWYKEKGFYNNPFSIKPAAFHDDLSGPLAKFRRINNLIATGNVCLITGAYGSGKTSILKRVIHRFRGDKKIVYFSCNRREDVLNLDRFLLERTFFNKLFGLKSKGMILLLDEVQGLSEKESNSLAYHYEQGYFRAIALATKDQTDLVLTSRLRKLIGPNVFVLQRLNSLEAVELVRRRIGPLKFLSDSIIRKIYRLDPNPRALLENCEDACRNAFNAGSKEVLSKHLPR